MDTLIKIILRKYKFTTNSYEDLIVFNSKVSENIDLGKNLFSFKEYDKVDLLFFSSNPNTILKVESFISENPVTLKCGDILSLSPGGDSDNMLVPGFYDISILHNTKEFKGLYSIEPNSINYDSLLTMRETLDNICKGLSLNLYYERNSIEYMPSNMSGLDILAFAYLESNSKKILSSLSSILNNPIEDVTKTYSLKENSRKPDNKSLRWQNKHCNIINTRTLYKEKSMILTYDNKENKLIKFIIERLFYSISKIDKKIVSHLNVLNKNKASIYSKINLLNSEKVKLQNLYNVNRRKNEIKRDIEILNLEIDNYNSKIDKLNNTLYTIKACKNNIAAFLNKDWVKNINAAIKIKPTQKFLKRIDYSFLYNIYLQILEKSNLTNPSKSFPSKKTSLLYEVYSVIIIKNIFEEIGFKWVDGWIKSASDILTFNGELSSGDKISLVNNDYRVEISYDKLLRRTSELRGTSESGIVASNSDRRKPDILISLYKSNTFIKGMIVEVKYRKASYLYNNNGETDVIHQLKEYRNLDYFDGSNKKISNVRPIQKVLVIYPGDKEYKYVETIYGFIFLTLLPIKDSTPIGYTLLKEEINSFLNENME